MSADFKTAIGWLAEKILDPPPLPDKRARRLVIVCRAAMPLGAVVHTSWIFAFWLVGSELFAVVNFIIASLWWTASLLAWGVIKPTMGRVGFFALACGVIEVPAHAVMATLWFGTEAGFYFYLLTAMATITLIFTLSYRQRLFVLFANGALLTAVLGFASTSEPVVRLGETENLLFLVSNAGGATLAIILILIFHDAASMRSEDRLQDAHDRAEGLLLNILPQSIAERLKIEKDVIAEEHADATILFADIVGFTETSARLAPSEIISRLNLVFSAFDDLSAQHGVEKIKTIGDAYMVVAGLPTPRQDHALVMAALARDMLKAVEKINENIDGEPIRIRIGLNSGPVVAGVIGRSKFAYDLWGDAVNVAARMEQTGVEGEARLTEATLSRLGDAVEFEDRGEVEVKGKGRMRVFALSPS